MRDHSAIRGRGGPVLVVDDNRDFRDTTSAVLRWGGYQVVAAAGTDDAMTLLAGGDIALVLLDYGLRSGQGLELLDRMEQGPPVILMSGLESPPAFHPKVSLFLSKPIEPERLLQAVASCVKTPA